MYDVIIIGSGPAGFTAGIYAARREMKVLIIGRELGGQLVWASEIENYPGFKNIGAFDLIEKMKEQTVKAGVEIKNDEVKKIEKMPDDSFKLYTNREKFSSKTIIIAMGLSPRRLAVDGEIEFNGRGVSYCANCDGPFFRNKEVVVVGGGNSALDAAEVLSKIAKHVYLVHHNDKLRAFDALVNKVKAKDNIEMVLNSEIKKISGQDKVEKILVYNIKTQTEREIKVDGVFIEIGRVASTDLVADLVERNEKNQILATVKMETKTPGLFVAGDVVEGEFKQITIATGQGTIAALSAYQYLQLKTGRETIARNY